MVQVICTDFSFLLLLLLLMPPNISYYGSCDTTNTFVNGGCTNGLTCSGSPLKCASLTAGQPCGNNLDYFNCAANLFCDRTDDTCKARLSANSNCQEHFNCDATLVCTNRGQAAQQKTCQAPFTGATGASCTDEFDCQAGLTCNPSGICAAPVTDGQVCGVGSPNCPTGTACVCEEETRSNGDVVENGDSFCARVDSPWTEDEVNDFKAFQQCTKENNCHDTFSSEYIGLRSGPNQCQADCIKKNYDAGFRKLNREFNRCNSSTAGALVWLSL